MDRDRVRVELGAEHAGELLRLRDLDEDGSVQPAQDQAVSWVVGELEPPVAVHRLGHVDQERVRHRVARIGQQRIDDRLGVVTGGTRIPQPEGRQPVRVHVLGRTFQLGERRDGHPAVAGVLVVDLEEQGLVGLDDQRAAGHRCIASGLGAQVSRRQGVRRRNGQVLHAGYDHPERCLAPNGRKS